LSVQAV